jgi:hypothetical protein
MTALSQYARLETIGLWRPGPLDKGREVVVSFGNATLVLADGSGLPLTHWSLPAVTRLNPGATPALFAPDEDGSETLEIEDDLMVSAIEKVRQSVARTRPRPPRQGPRLAWVVLPLVALALLIWLPGLLQREALSVVPASKKTELGATILGHLQRTLGPACRDPLGSEALSRLHDRVLGEAGQTVVLPLGPRTPLVLPGSIVVLSREMVERTAEPAAVAGHLIAAATSPEGRDPLGHLLDEAGLFATIRLLTSGSLDSSALEGYARDLLAEEPPEPDAAELGPAFAAAEVPISPYALDLDPSGATVAELLAADPFEQGEAPILLSDSDWVALQGICDGG